MTYNCDEISLKYVYILLESNAVRYGSVIFDYPSYVWKHAKYGELLAEGFVFLKWYNFLRINSRDQLFIYIYIFAKLRHFAVWYWTMLDRKLNLQLWNQCEKV